MSRLAAAITVGLLGVTAGGSSATAAMTDITPSPAVVPIRATAGTALAMTSPQNGELWVAEKAANGTLLLEHRYQRTWSSRTLPVAAGSSVAMDSSAHNDVWLVTAGTLWHGDGRGWHRIALPKAPLGGQVAAISVADVPGADVYVGLTGGFPNGGSVYRLRGTRWSSLGNPETAVGVGSWATPVRLTMGGTKLFAVWSRSSSGTAYNSHSAYRYDAGSWTKLYTANVNVHYTTSRLGALIAPSATHHVALGTASNYGKESGLCLAWSSTGGAAGTMNSCTTSAPVAAADVLADGRILVGGADYVSTSYRDTATPVTTQGAFALRAADGTETAVAGDPGDRAVAVETVPGTNSAWVLTSTSGKTTLRSFTG